jgi:hypothetical protein
MEPLIKQNGAVNGTVEYLGRADGKWIAVPATVGSQIKGPCSRIDLLKQHAGIDIQGDVPGRRGAQGGCLEPRQLPEGRGSLPQGRRAVRHRARRHHVDSVDTAGAFFHAFGARWSMPRATSREVRPGAQALEYMKKLMPRSCRPTRRPGTTRPTTSGWCPARAR